MAKLIKYQSLSNTHIGGNSYVVVNRDSYLAVLSLVWGPGYDIKQDGPREFPKSYPAVVSLYGHFTSSHECSMTWQSLEEYRAYLNQKLDDVSQF